MTPRFTWTIRARITALVSGLVMAVGGILLSANYWWLTRNLPSVLAQERAGEMFVVIDGAEPIPVPTECTYLDPLQEAGRPQVLSNADSPVGTVHGRAVAADPGSAALPVGAMPDSSFKSPKGECFYGPSVRLGETGVVGAAVVGAAAIPDPIRGAVEATSQGMATWVTDQLGQQLLLLLLVLTIVAVIAGWVAARRSLAPIHWMNERARLLGASSLSERLPLSGPRDEIGELGATFNALLDRVEQAVVREQRLVANLAHELRTPLANQRIVLEVAMEANGQGAEADRDGLAEAARTALQQNLRTQRLVEQLLLLARIEHAADGMFEEVEVDLVEAVEMLVAAPTLATLGPADVQIVLNLPEAGRTTVRAEPLLLDCLIGNLLENAVRHNVPGGVVSITVPTPLPGAGPELWIENTGPVMASEVLPSLFEPLRRGPMAGCERRRDRAGIGLGLALVVAITERFGVALSAEPREQGGLRIGLRWPAQRAGATVLPNTSTANS